LEILALLVFKQEA